MKELTPRQKTLRLWQDAVRNAHEALNSASIHAALSIMQASQRAHEEGIAPPLFDSRELCLIDLAYKRAARDGLTEIIPVKGAVVHVYEDDTMILINYGREIPEIFAHHRERGTIFVGVLLDGQLKITF